MRHVLAGGVASVICGVALVGEVVAAPFAPGNLAVYRKAPGMSGDHVPVFVDEYTPAGQLVQSLPMPTTTVGNNRRLTVDVSTELDGNLTRSVDGRYLTLTGLDSPAGAPPFTSAIVVGRVDASGGVDTTTSFADWNPPFTIARGSATLDGSGFFLVGSANGVRYAAHGASTSTSVAGAPNTARNVNVFGGQLYVSTGSPTYSGVVAVGPVGTSTAPGQTVTNLPGVPGLLDNSLLQFFFADLDAATTGLDTLYIAAQGAPKLSKYSLVSGTWAATGTVGVAEDDYRGLTGVLDGSSVTLFATRTRGTVSELVSLTDTSGFNGTLTGTPTLLAATSDGSRLQGVAFTPIPEPATAVVFVTAIGLWRPTRTRRRPAVRDTRRVFRAC